MNLANAQARQALWFDGQSARAWAVDLRVEGETLFIAPQGAAELRVPGSQLQWLGGYDAPQPMLRLPEGGQLLLPSRQLASDLGLQAPTPSALLRALASTPALLVALFLWVVLLFVLIGWVLPPTADWAAGHLPTRIEKRLGADVLRAFDGAYLAPSELSDVERARIAQRVDELGRAAGINPLVVAFRKGTRIGPNAVAIPGGVVLITDELYALLGNSPRLDAVVAHELGHLQARHGMRKYLRQAGVGLLFVFVLPDPDMADQIAQRFAKQVLLAGHSRDAEREADAFARNLLAKTGRSPADLAEALRLLAAKTGIENHNGGFLSSHPGIQERIDTSAGKP